MRELPELAINVQPYGDTGLYCVFAYRDPKPWYPSADAHDVVALSKARATAVEQTISAIKQLSGIANVDGSLTLNSSIRAYDDLRLIVTMLPGNNPEACKPNIIALVTQLLHGWNT